MFNIQDITIKYFASKEVKHEIIERFRNDVNHINAFNKRYYACKQPFQSIQYKLRLLENETDIYSISSDFIKYQIGLRKVVQPDSITLYFQQNQLQSLESKECCVEQNEIINSIVELMDYSLRVYVKPYETLHYTLGIEKLKKQESLEALEHVSFINNIVQYSFFDEYLLTRIIKCYDKIYRHFVERKQQIDLIWKIEILFNQQSSTYSIKQVDWENTIQQLTLDEFIDEFKNDYGVDKFTNHCYKQQSNMIEDQTQASEQILSLMQAQIDPFRKQKSNLYLEFFTTQIKSRVKIVENILDIAFKVKAEEMSPLMLLQKDILRFTVVVDNFQIHPFLEFILREFKMCKFPNRSQITILEIRKGQMASQEKLGKQEQGIMILVLKQQTETEGMWIFEMQVCEYFQQQVQFIYHELFNQKDDMRSLKLNQTQTYPLEKLKVETSLVVNKLSKNKPLGDFVNSAEEWFQRLSECRQPEVRANLDWVVWLDHRLLQNRYAWVPLTEVNELNVMLIDAFPILDIRNLNELFKFKTDNYESVDLYSRTIALLFSKTNSYSENFDVLMRSIKYDLENRHPLEKSVINVGSVFRDIQIMQSEEKSVINYLDLIIQFKKRITFFQTRLIDFCNLMMVILKDEDGINFIQNEYIRLKTKYQESQKTYIKIETDFFYEILFVKLELLTELPQQKSTFFELQNENKVIKFYENQEYQRTKMLIQIEKNQNLMRDLEEERGLRISSERELQATKMAVEELRETNRELVKAQDLLQVIENQKKALGELREENEDLGRRCLIQKANNFKIIDHCNALLPPAQRLNPRAQVTTLARARAHPLLYKQGIHDFQCDLHDADFNQQAKVLSMSHISTGQYQQEPLQPLKSIKSKITLDKKHVNNQNLAHQSEMSEIKLNVSKDNNDDVILLRNNEDMKSKCDKTLIPMSNIFNPYIELVRDLNQVSHKRSASTRPSTKINNYRLKTTHYSNSNIDDFKVISINKPSKPSSRNSNSTFNSTRGFLKNKRTQEI